MHTFSQWRVGTFALALAVIAVAGCSQIVDDELPNDVNALDPFMQAMHYAKSGDVSNLKAVIGSDPGVVTQATETGMTLLHYAAIASQPETVKLLIENGADVNAEEDSDYFTPLRAAEEEHADETVLTILRDAGGT